MGKENKGVNEVRDMERGKIEDTGRGRGWEKEND